MKRNEETECFQTRHEIQAICENGEVTTASMNVKKFLDYGNSKRIREYLNFEDGEPAARDSSK